jgi:ActR/RegA family two-component response regulator
MNNKEHRGTILLVDDDDILRSRLLRAFRERGFHAEDACDWQSALTACDAKLALFRLIRTGSNSECVLTRQISLPAGVGLFG